MKWFGETWNAPVNDNPHTKTPIGQPCWFCEKAISDEDQGLVLPFYREKPPADGTGPFKVFDANYHLDCFLQSVGVNPY